jgi:ATP-dependent Clp protease ATP-binding subunit ClpB
MFLGTTGVGKTELAKALAELLFDNENNITRIDMSEYQERHSISRLIGSPPGYVGYDESGQLTEAIRRKPYSVVLLDEIEKAHPDTFNILLQVLDEGRLTDNKGRVADFKNCIIIMTSNLGSDEIQKTFENNQSFEKAEELAILNVMELLKKNIRPEFLNRLDEIILFTPLTRNEIEKIVKLQITITQNKLKEKSINLFVTDEAISNLSKKGFDPQYGGRPVKRIIQQKLLNPLSKKLLSNSIQRKKQIIFDYVDSTFIFRNGELISSKD